MKNHGMNPYLPSWEYVPDGEPHVFGKRVYIYGSHDRFMLFNVCTVGIDTDKQHIIILKVKIRLIRIIRQTKVTEVVCIFVMVSSYRSNRNGMFFCKQMKLLCSSKCIRNSIHLVTHTDDHCWERV